MFEKPLIKLAAIAVVLALIVGLIYFYGQSKYDAGVKDQKLADQTEVLRKYEANKEALDSILDSSRKAADMAATTATNVSTGLDVIAKKYAGRPMTVINQQTGDCIPSPDFIGGWNALSTYKSAK